MPYSVKLKDQTGTENVYNSVEQVSLPQSSGTTNAEFMAKYNVNASGNLGETYYGGNTAAHGVDYVCCIYSPDAPLDVKSVKIGGYEVESDAYNFESFGEVVTLQIYGNKITGDIDILINNA